MFTKAVNYVGVMSGSSLDGLDLALVQFILDPQDDILSWEILRAETIPFTKDWESRLTQFKGLTTLDYLKLESEFSQFIGQAISQFTQDEDVTAIGVHGHTLVHYPDENITLQLGDGGVISAITGRDVVTDFRIQDILKGGCGAPIVPAVERTLFSEYDAFINLGGIANISFHNEDQVIAYDICPCNQLLNNLAQKLGKDYDDGGALSAQGSIDHELLERLQAIEYFHQEPPKALDNNWIAAEVTPLFDDVDPIDGLATAVEFIVAHLCNNIPSDQKVLVTGGGALNTHMMNELMNRAGQSSFEVPQRDIIEYKEALLMAYMAYTRVYNKVNVFQSVTGSTTDTVAGAYYKGGVL